MMKEAVNEVYVEGILAEMDVRDLDNGVKAGKFIIQVDFNPEGNEEISSLVAVEFYAAPKTKAGKPNPAYKSIMGIVEGAKTLADGCSPEEATKVRVAKASIRENVFISRDEKLITTTRINGSFFDKVKTADFKPNAHFKVRLIVSKIEDELKNIEGELQETGALQVTGMIVQWTPATEAVKNLDEVKFLVKNKKYIDAVQKYWNRGDTVNAQGYFRFVTELKESSEESGGFGESAPTVYTRNIKEYIINDGSPGPVDDGYEEVDIVEASNKRRNKIATLVEGGSKKEVEPPKQEKIPNKKADW